MQDAENAWIDLASGEGVPENREYSKDNSWEYEITFGTGVFLKSSSDSHGAGFEVQYHIGRFPSLILFRTESVHYTLVSLSDKLKQSYKNSDN